MRAGVNPCAPNGPGEKCGGMHSDGCVLVSLLDEDGEMKRAMDLIQACGRDAGCLVGRSCKAAGMCSATKNCQMSPVADQCVCSLECDFSRCLQPRIVLLLRK